MRAAAFIRYHSGDGFGHVGWAFDAASGLVNAGSVENHSGHIFTPATKMGFWNGEFADAAVPMRAHGYDDVKWIDVPNADAVLAYRTVLWIKHNAYRVLHRNCEDDVYDVLRAYGVQNLPLPMLHWFPRTWFHRFRGNLAHVDEFQWSERKASNALQLADPPGAGQMWQPTWRRPLHADFHALKLARAKELFTRR